MSLIECLSPEDVVVDFFVSNHELLRNRASLYQMGSKRLIEVLDLYNYNIPFRRDVNKLIPDYSESIMVEEKKVSSLLNKYMKDKEFNLRIYKRIEICGKILIRDYNRRSGNIN